MSFKAKDLTYDSKEPAFLQRLKNQYGNSTGRLERPAARPRLAKRDDEDDAPTYVDEESNEVLTKEEYEALVRGDDPQKAGEATDGATPQQREEPSVGDNPTDTARATPKQNVVDVGGPRKRKQAKVVGEESSAGRDQTPPKELASTKPKGKKKKIKLSFDDA
ncbi:hypothetical protein P168DRAFT_290638 [Aspergillus campestris IBT 28561]|uniref:DUF4604 domain-containing protein n=1 Tax=Aspergillus campestris (strain IBT 28561) TaxID=1392248 RepID=A0A2I1D0R1_ASPC2|nr:uncharacterized protein P168DRAFT_290638 [Aspergillus campestris IBT 28561]PKY03470.1 hypothetical protein P168DRAFT_290638 [Aspergillus campestris IBT 28561]